jgi:hypothetical protein
LRGLFVESSASLGAPPFYSSGVDQATARSTTKQEEGECPLEEHAMQSLAKLVQSIGPYLVMAIVMPGGMFIALGLYLYRRHRVG